VPEKSAIAASFIPGLNASQAIFSPGLLYAATSARLYTKAAKQVIDSSKINIVVAVSKSFYNLLLNLQEIDVLKQDTVYLAKSVTDAYHQYIGGIVDITDYQEATITLNNTISQLKQANENVVPYYAALKQMMGYPPRNQFNVSFDTAQMIKDILLDTTQQLQFEKRIEYQQLQTARALQHKLTNYYWFNFLPSLGAYFNYNYEYENNKFDGLLATAYPNSVVGVSLNLPLFTGLSRIESVRRSKMQEKLFDYSQQYLESVIYNQYTTAIANYKSNLFNMHAQQDNAAMARNVYNIVDLQYRQGIVPYLNVITAQSNFISSEIGYLNALFQVLESKIDVEQAMGNITY
jgi:outer membrane protein TolC